MAITTFTLLNKARKKLADGTIDLDTHSFVVLLCGSSQAIAANFAGTSTDARYADLTGELATANGYTQKNKALASVTWTESSGVITFDAADTAWTLTGAGVTYKYIVIIDDTATNEDILGFVNVDDSGGSATISPAAGVHTITWNASGLFSLTQTS